jgi:hypothetical protein
MRQQTTPVAIIPSSPLAARSERHGRVSTVVPGLLRAVSARAWAKERAGSAIQG